MEKLEGSLGRKMEVLIEKVESRLGKVESRLEKVEGMVEELVVEGRTFKENREKEDVPVSCLHVINAYDFFITSPCATAMSKCCLWSIFRALYICIDGVCKSIIHGVARHFTSLLLQAVPGIFSGLPTHTPYAFALAAVSVLFMDQELSSSLLFESAKSQKPGLDQTKVEMLLGMYEI